jgi:hypothetical protein
MLCNLGKEYFKITVGHSQEIEDEKLAYHGTTIQIEFNSMLSPHIQLFKLEKSSFTKESL